ncbi:transposase [Mesorhizobium intechi]|nr:transposase [Mesorhizobium intechi]
MACRRRIGHQRHHDPGHDAGSCRKQVRRPPLAGAAVERHIRELRQNLQTDYARVNPLPDAVTALGKIAGWFEDYNENHPHSGLRMRFPREFIRAQTQ